MSSVSQKDRQRVKYVSVPQDNFKFQEYGTKKRRKDSDDQFGQRNAAAASQESGIDHRIKINETCLFSQHNESEWKGFRRGFEATQMLIYAVTLFITIASLANSIWMLFFSRFSLLLNVLDLYDKLNNELIEHSLVIYFAIEICSLLIDVVRGFYLLRLFQLLNLRGTFTSTGLLAVDVKNFKVDVASLNLEDKLVESMNHLRLRIKFREFFHSIQSSLKMLDILVAGYFIVFVFAAKYVVATLILVGIPGLKNVYNTSQRLDHLILKYPDFSERVQTTFGCTHFSKFNQTKAENQEGRDCLNALYDSALILYIVLSIILILTATFKLFIQVTQALLFNSQFLVKLVRMHEKDDIELWEKFDDSKKKILALSVQGALDESALNSPFRNTRPPEATAEEDDDDDDAFEEPHNRQSNADQRYINVGNDYVNSQTDNEDTKA